MKSAWRFVLGGAIGLGLGYALVLLLHPLARERKRQAPAAERPREEQPVS